MTRGLLLFTLAMLISCIDLSDDGDLTLTKNVIAGATVETAWIAPTMDVAGNPLDCDPITFTIFGRSRAEGLDWIRWADGLLASDSPYAQDNVPMGCFEVHMTATCTNEHGSEESAPSNIASECVGDEYFLPPERSEAPQLAVTGDGDPRSGRRARLLQIEDALEAILERLEALE